jgi:hypothetical protein
VTDSAGANYENATPWTTHGEAAKNTPTVVPPIATGGGAGKLDVEDAGRPTPGVGTADSSVSSP